jgi:hypothetical protein
MRSRSLAAWAVAWCAAFGLAVMQGCGGGVGSGGTGMSEGVAQGTVSGFGSVIVDGDRFDDSQVPTLEETEPGVLTQTEARLGERVELEYDRSGAARRLMVQSALVGAVETVDAPSGFTVLGQSVVVNNEPRRGPVTQYAGGYTGLGSVQAGEAVEVHGFVVRSGSGYSIQATRVKKRTALPAYVKVTGLASDVGPADFRLGALVVGTATATVLPEGRSLAGGQLVSVLAAADTLKPAQAAAPVRLRAAQVRIRSLGAVGTEVYVSGVISAYVPREFGFDLDGSRISYPGAVVSPAGSVLLDGLYVQVRGVVTGEGTIRATAVKLRDGRSESEAELKGTIVAYDAATERFVVRGVSVDASRAKIEECPGGKLADGLYVSVEGSLDATTVIAKSVHCEGESDDATIERKGVAGSVDSVAQRFVLQPGSGSPLNVSWTSSTYFKNVTVATLAGQSVEVEGKVIDGVLVAQKVSVKSASDSEDEDEKDD